MFGLLFVGCSFPIPASGLQQVDPTHWVLDACSAVRPDYWELKEATLFLSGPIDAAAAVGLYVRAGDSGWLYRGCVHNGRPSEVMPLQWPTGGGGDAVAPQPGAVQVGISIEPLAELSAKEGGRLGDKVDYARRVGLDLVHFMGSFPTQAVNGGEVMLVPANVMALWFAKFERKFRRDPDFLTRQRENI
ncbi:hypothetical protein Rsub_09692 [Raphidocelis subcapitata]|uniref:Hikeshi-like C-terminal domain-containing protein n=1 Tax=Raphidocelis subcapitata TaxID=307507 RepID=A0A2V0PAG0_9CHLO|nr:hypothetical protein Rsub_09692 [Raphidocelis subcapitata]|eukprot:GBF96836.1 hypothetical protein Rsub_09692 [Raphidocelis subcapitata]